MLLARHRAPKWYRRLHSGSDPELKMGFGFLTATYFCPNPVSASRFIAGAAGFLHFTQSRERPEWSHEVLRFGKVRTRHNIGA
jgi:hypothetical protein